MVFILENDPAYIRSLVKAHKKNKGSKLGAFAQIAVSNEHANVAYIRLGFLG